MRNGPYELVVAPPEYPGKRYRDRYCYEHQLVWWQHTGRLVGEGRLIHHRNDKKRDNRFENLEEVDRNIHTKQHSAERAPDLIEVECGWCGKGLSMMPNVFNQRMKQSRSGKLFCSRSCGAKNQHSEIV